MQCEGLRVAKWSLNAHGGFSPGGLTPLTSLLRKLLILSALFSQTSTFSATAETMRTEVRRRR